MNTWRMKLRQHVCLWMTVIVFGLPGTLASAGEPSAMMTENDKASYVTGVDIVRTLIRQGGQVNLDLVIQGIMDGLAGDKLLVNEKELQKTLTALQTERKQRQACQDMEFADLNREFCSGDSSSTRSSSPVRAQDRNNEDERMSAALFAATLAPPRADGQKTPVLSESQFQSQAPVPGPPGQPSGEQKSPEVMLAAQVPAKTEAPVTFEMSELTRRFGSYWSKSHPH